MHHNFDKIGLLGGASHVKFGAGYLTKPIRVLLNGRASIKFANTTIPIRELLISWTKDFFRKRLPYVNVNNDLDFHFNLSTESSPGKIYANIKKASRIRWFEPLNTKDLPELKKPFANDTAVGIGYAPFSTLERIVLIIEKKLTSRSFQKNNPWLGSDIKIMALREGEDYFFTICIPQIAKFVKNLSQYKKNLNKAKTEIEYILAKFEIKNYEININTRDKFNIPELYLTVTGSSLESGDEGLTGRGNRINGLITPMRPMSIECPFGKNPVYQVGKVYYKMAYIIARKLYKKFKNSNEIFLISQSGRALIDPWIVLVNMEKRKKTNLNIKEIKDIIKNELCHLRNLWKNIINYKD